MYVTEVLYFDVKKQQQQTNKTKQKQTKQKNSGVANLAFWWLAHFSPTLFFCVNDNIGKHWQFSLNITIILNNITVK